ncbi:DNA polymerase III delta prime subunit [Ochrobactrum sp. P20RRXII]|nr:DNA polymerase III delta prime subunit [Ochrobactrum sp. P20RRXII]
MVQQQKRVTCLQTLVKEYNRSNIMKHAGEILILTGPPGSGKTTTGLALAKESGSPKVHLHSDDFWHFIKNGAIPPYLPEANEQNAVVMDVLAGVAEAYAKGGYFVIVDGIIGPWFLQPFRRLATPLHYVVLRPPLDVAILRCQERGGATLNDPAPITALHQQFSSMAQLERHVLSTDGKDRHETLGMVIEAVEGGKFQLAT